METIIVPKEAFIKILTDVEVLIDDVEIALNEKVRSRVADVDSGKVEGKSEEDYYTYLEKRGIKFDGIRS